jgi:hypothetical protein
MCAQKKGISPLKLPSIQPTPPISVGAKKESPVRLSAIMTSVAAKKESPEKSSTIITPVAAKKESPEKLWGKAIIFYSTPPKPLTKIPNLVKFLSWENVRTKKRHLLNPQDKLKQST